MRTTSALAWAFFSRFAGMISIAALVLGGAAMALILISSGQEASKIVGAVATGAVALGISWKSTTATLGQIAAHLEHPLWQAELDAAIGSAITTLDRHRHAPSVQEIAARVSPQGPAEI